TTITSTGVTTNGGTGPSLTTTGINAANTVITNVAAGTAPTDAVNVSQLNAVNATAGAGWNVSAQGANATNVGPNSA
ncbi:hypothetical protein, partial [Ralstonia sp. NT80]